MRFNMITVYIPGPLRDHCRGASEVKVRGANVREILQGLQRNFPGVYQGVCDETGQVRRHINIFVNAYHMRDCNGLETPLGERDVVTILPAVSGG